MLTGVTRAFSDDIAIDLGTANTLVHVVGRGIIIDEPSVVAVQVRGGQREVLAVGMRAKAMQGKTPEPVEILRPMRDGVIADFLATEEMLRQFISRAKTMLGFRRPRILICVPAGATPVERRAVYETALSAGASRVFLIDEPVAASLGAGLPIDGAAAFMVVDIGGGTTDIAVISLFGVVIGRSVRVAGDAMDEAIAQFLKKRHDLLVGERTAEAVKIEIGSAAELDAPVTMEVKGRHMSKGVPRRITITDAEIREALAEPLKIILRAVRETLDQIPPEISADIYDRGIALCGGGSLLRHLDRRLREETRLPVQLVEDPLSSVVLGAGKMLSDERLLKTLSVH